MARARVVLAVLVASLASRAGAEGVRRAVVIGIDRYTPGAQRGPLCTPGLEGAGAFKLGYAAGDVAAELHAPAVPRGRGAWGDLQGAAADAEAIHRVLVVRYGFEERNVRVLIDEQATRACILDALGALARESAEGDLAVIVYAGHGSLVYNSLSRERRDFPFDESIVPADSWTGALDIRDKELADAANAILDKKARLVGFFDSCHSGSISRGPAGAIQGLSRRLPYDPRDARDGRRRVDPLGRGAVFLSAAQEDELAWEVRDEEGNPRGLFSYALQQALLAAEPTETLADLFRRVKATMANLASHPQEPAAQGRIGMDQPLLGGGGLSAPLRIAIVAVDGPEVLLDGGRDLELTPGTELALPGRGEQVIVRVERLEGFSRSVARVASGDGAALRAGGLLEVKRWAPPQTASLRIWAPVAELSAKQLVALASSVRGVVQRTGAALVEDPFAEAPTHVVYFDAGWRLSTPEGADVELGSKLDSNALASALAAPHGGSSPARVWLELPAPGELRTAVAFGVQGEPSEVAAASRAGADYHLAGRVSGGALQLGWVRPWERRPGQTLPAVMAWRAPGEALQLHADALRLARVARWLTLQPPPTEEGRFAYRVRIRRPTEHPIDPATGCPAVPNEPWIEGPVESGARVELVLEAKPGVTASNVERRFLYVQELFCDGSTELFVPESDADEGNTFPMKAPDGRYQFCPQYVLGSFEVESAGTLVAVATSTKPSDAGALSSEGQVVSRGPRHRLESLFASPGVVARDASERPAWSVQRIPLVPIAGASPKSRTGGVPCLAGAK